MISAGHRFGRYLSPTLLPDDPDPEFHGHTHIGTR